jgi:hypothetical protein
MEAMFLPAMSAGSGSASITNVNVSYSHLFPVQNWGAIGLRPFFNAFMLGGPDSLLPAFPEAAYGLGVDVPVYVKINEKWSLGGSMSPSVFTNFENLDGSKYLKDIFRFPTRLNLNFQLDEEHWFSVGVMFTNNPRGELLPTGGFAWVPSDQFKMELMFPRTRVFYRLTEQAAGYAFFQYTANSYTVYEEDRFSSGYYSAVWAQGTMQYDDCRAGLGLEWTFDDRAALTAELGVAFLRKLFYYGVNPSFNLDPTIYARTGVRF